MKATALRHARELSGLKPSWYTFRFISLISFIAMSNIGKLLKVPIPF